MPNVWNPVFMKPMFEMAKLRSAMFGVPNMLFSRQGQFDARFLQAAGVSSARERALHLSRNASAIFEKCSSS